MHLILSCCALVNPASSPGVIWCILHAQLLKEGVHLEWQAQLVGVEHVNTVMCALHGMALVH